MPRALSFLLIALSVAGCSRGHVGGGDKVTPLVQAAINKLRVGMTEESALAVMKPVALDYVRITYGGTGSGELWFLVSQRQQFCVALGPYPDFKVQQIGHLQSKTKWIRDSRGALSLR
jgi:hypothetical protein